MVLFIILLIAGASGCKQEKEAKITYPYNNLDFKNITRIQFFTALESTHWVEDKTKIQEITKLINNSKFIRYSGNEGGIGH